MKRVITSISFLIMICLFACGKTNGSTSSRPDFFSKISADSKTSSSSSESDSSGSSASSEINSSQPSSSSNSNSLESSLSSESNSKGSIQIGGSMDDSGYTWGTIIRPK